PITCTLRAPLDGRTTCFFRMLLPRGFEVTRTNSVQTTPTPPWLAIISLSAGWVTPSIGAKKLAGRKRNELALTPSSFLLRCTWDSRQAASRCRAALLLARQESY